MREYMGLGVLEINEVSLYLGLSKIRIYRLVEKGKIPGEKRKRG
jgi:excisionase family DNA binding protein